MKEDKLTGAMYSSVPTNELDWVTGSATNVGGGWLRDLRFFGCGGFIICPPGNYFIRYER